MEPQTACLDEKGPTLAGCYNHTGNLVKNNIPEIYPEQLCQHSSGGSKSPALPSKRSGDPSEQTEFRTLDYIKASVWLRLHRDSNIARRILCQWFTNMFREVLDFSQNIFELKPVTLARHTHQPLLQAPRKAIQLHEHKSYQAGFLPRACYKTPSCTR